jgi:hypothetical protein
VSANAAIVIVLVLTAVILGIAIYTIARRK